MSVDNPKINMIIGPRQSGKTTMALHAAMGIATGRNVVAFLSPTVAMSRIARRRLPPSEILRSLDRRERDNVNWCGEYLYFGSVASGLDVVLHGIDSFLIILDDVHLMLSNRRLPTIMRSGQDEPVRPEEFAARVAERYRSHVWAIESVEPIASPI